jgi:hypothetical protein
MRPASFATVFGSMGVCGTANNSVISGVLVCRGDDILPVVQTGPDWEGFNYQKLSLDNEQDVKFIEKAFDWTLEVDGKAWADGKPRIASRRHGLVLTRSVLSCRQELQVKRLIARPFCSSCHSTHCMLDRRIEAALCHLTKYIFTTLLAHDERVASDCVADDTSLHCHSGGNAWRVHHE